MKKNKPMVINRVKNKVEGKTSESIIIDGCRPLKIQETIRNFNNNNHKDSRRYLN
jgi:hypothetical protein